MIKYAKTIGCAALFVAAALLPAPPAAADEKRLIDEVVERGELRVGMSSFVPWAMRDQQGGFIGFEIDVAQKLADDLGVKLNLVPTKWDGIIPALLTGKFDMIIAGMSITAPRSLQVNFSSPYAHSGLDVVVNLKRLPGASSLADFNSPEIVIAMRRGSSGVAQVKGMLPEAKIRLFDDEASCRQEVINGSAHAWISSAPAPAFAAEGNPGKLYLPLNEIFARSSEAIGIRRGDPDTLAFLNGWIASNTASGWLQNRHDYWFRGKPWASMVGDNS